MSRARSLLFVPLVCLLWWACSEGTGPSRGAGDVGLGIVPSFQVDPALFPTGPVDRIRLTAYDATTDEVVGSFDQSVSPTAPQWALSLAIDLGEAESLEIVVDAELFSGSEVTWSGRLGPITVPTGAPAVALDVYRGSLDNLDVTSVVILAAPPVLIEGTSQDIVATVSMVPGSTADPVVYWASSDTSVLTVDAAGTSVTITAVAEGTADVIASAGAADDQVTIEVIALGTATKTWVGGDAANPTLWSDPDNWMPAGVPAAFDVVLVPSTANDPAADAAVTITGLTVSAGATVDLADQAFVVSGNLSVDGSVTGGEIEVSGPGTLLEGTLEALRVTSDRVVSGTLSLFGNLTLEATLSVARESVYVGGGLTTTGGGALGMTAPGGLVTATNATFSGASQEGLLTQGQLYVAGDFVASGDPLSFAAATGHTVVLSGGSTQTVDFEQAGPSAGRFGTLLIQGGTTVDLAGDAYAGELGLDGMLAVAAGQTFGVAGTLTLGAGATLQVDGTVTAGSCVDNGGIVLGSGSQPCGAVQQYTKVWVGGDAGGATSWDIAANWNPAGVPSSNDTVLVNTVTNDPVLTSNVLVAAVTVADASTVNLNGQTLQVTGNVDAGSNGFSSGTVLVQGTGTVFEGVFDDVDVWSDRSLSGYTWANGAVRTQADLAVGNNVLSIIDSLWVTTNGRLVMTQTNDAVFVGGNAIFDGLDLEGSLTAGYLSVQGDFTVGDVSSTAFAATGTHVVEFDGTAAQTVSFGQPGSTQQRLNDVTISGASDVSFATDAYVSGDMDVFGRLDVPAGSTLEVAGDVTLYNTSTLNVDGTLIVTGTCTDLGALIQGAGTQPCGEPASADFTWLGGAAAAPEAWSDPTNWSPVGVPGPNDAVLVQGAAYSPTLSGAVTVGSLVVGGTNGVYLNGSTLTVVGDVAADGYGISGGPVVLSGAGNVQGIFYDDVQILGNRTMSELLYIYGGLTLEADLAVGQHYLYVQLDFLATGTGGRLVMNEALGNAYFEGNTTFDGADHTDALTAGAMYIIGGLTVPATSPQGFVSSGSHVVYFSGSSTQTVDFGAPGPGQQTLGTVEASSAFALTFVNGAYLTGSMSVYGHLIVPNGTAIAVTGPLTVYGSATVEAYGSVSVGGACTVVSGALVIGDGLPCGTPVLADRVWVGGDPLGPSDWNIPGNWMPAGVPASNESVVVPVTTNDPVLSDNQSVLNLAVGPGAELDLGGFSLTVAEDARASGQVLNGLTDLVDDVGGHVVSGNYDDLRIAGTGTRALAGYLTTTGDLDVLVGLEVPAFGVQVYGNLNVTSATGGLRLVDPSAYVNVEGNATFDGESSTENLTQGWIYLRGDLTVNSTYATDAFRMTGGQLYLLGSLDQTVNLSNPVDQSFYNVALSGGAKNLASDMFVDGYLNASNVTVNAEPGATVEVSGSGAVLYLTDVTFDGPSLRLASGQNTDLHILSGLTFRGQSSVVSQLYLELPMGTNALDVDAPVFGTVPISGNYIEAVNPGLGTLEIQVNSPTPASDGGYTKTSGATIKWGP